MNELPSPSPEPLGAGIDFSDPSSPLAPYYLQASHVVAAVLLGVIAFVLSHTALFHTDIWCHLAYGRWIAEQGVLPETEPLSSFTDRDAPMAHFQWLAQLAFYWVWRLGTQVSDGSVLGQLEAGVAGLRTLTLLLGVAYAWVLVLAFRRAAGSLPVACGGLLVLLFLSWTFTILRPQVFGQICFALLLWSLSGPVLSRRLLWGLPLLFVLWGNLHGSFVVGFYLAGLIFAGRLIQAARSAETGWRGALRSGEIRSLFFGLAASVLAVSLLNPHGVMIYSRVLELGAHPNISWFDEWQPLAVGFTSFTYWRYAATLLLIGVSWAAARSAPPWPQGLVLAGFVFLPLLQTRMLVWWFPLAVWGTMPWWSKVVGVRPSTPSFIKTIMVGLLVVALLPFTPPVRWLLNGRPTPLPQAVHRDTPWPIALQLAHPETKIFPPLVEALEEVYPGGRFEGAIFTSETQGEFFVWQTPERPVFMFTHVHLFSPEHWREVLRVRLVEPGWREVLHRRGINLVVVEAANHAALLTQLSRDPDWRILSDGRNPALPLIVALRKRPL